METSGMALLMIICVTATLQLLINSSSAVTSIRQGNPLQFTYSGAKGPGNWGNLNPKFMLCANGKSQSPIDIVTKHAVINKSLTPLIRDYRPSTNVSLVDYKFTVGIEYPEHTGEITVHGKQYALKQMHWHSPSEHRINGKRYAAELHMVHVADDGNISVVATLFKHGHPDSVIGKIYNKLNELANEFRSHEATPISVLEAFPPKELRKTPRKYYIYTGSFSAPPCTENIIYLVLAKGGTGVVTGWIYCDAEEGVQIDLEDEKARLP